MNRVSKTKLVKLADKCAAVLRDKARQSETIWRGEMRAIVSAAHELRKRGVLAGERHAWVPDVDGATCTKCGEWPDAPQHEAGERQQEGR